jgi:hypothetical protein
LEAVGSTMKSKTMFGMILPKNDSVFPGLLPADFRLWPSAAAALIRG